MTTGVTIRRSIVIDLTAAEFEVAILAGQRDRVAELIAAGYPRDERGRQMLARFVRSGKFPRPRGNPNFRTQYKETIPLQRAARLVKKYRPYCLANGIRPIPHQKEIIEEVAAHMKKNGYSFITEDRLVHFVRRSKKSKSWLA